MSQFPPQLIERLQKHFAAKFHKQLTSQEATEYLDSWGDFYLTVVDWHNINPLRGQAGPPATGGVRPP
jgi:hypothetical protein